MNSSHYFNLIHVFKKNKKDKQNVQNERRPSQNFDDDYCSCSGSDESINQVGLSVPSPSQSPPSASFYNPRLLPTSSTMPSPPLVSGSPPKKSNDRFLHKFSSHLHKSSKAPQEHICITNGYERLG